MQYPNRLEGGFDYTHSDDVGYLELALMRQFKKGMKWLAFAESLRYVYSKREDDKKHGGKGTRRQVKSARILSRTGLRNAG